jgi:hypothetical protein
VKKIILFILVFSVGATLFGQNSDPNNPPVQNTGRSDRKAEKRQRINSIIKQEEEGNLSFRKQSVVGIQLRTNGYGIFYELGKRKSARYTNLYTFELTEIKHRKEEKSGGADQFFSNAYVYGKENNFYQAKLGFGQQYILGQKGNKNGVAVTASLSGGIDIGLLKPYYLDVRDGGVDKSIKIGDDTTLFLSRGNIYGSSGFTKGWNELKVKPGVYLKSALRFDFGRYNESVQALEIGLSVEGFSEKIPILVYNDAQQIFVQMHIAFVFGGRK